jgi:hypothetical protein
LHSCNVGSAGTTCKHRAGTRDAAPSLQLAAPVHESLHLAMYACRIESSVDTAAAAAPARTMPANHAGAGSISNSQLRKNMIRIGEIRQYACSDPFLADASAQAPIHLTGEYLTTDCATVLLRRTPRERSSTIDGRLRLSADCRNRFTSYGFFDVPPSPMLVFEQSSIS